MSEAERREIEPGFLAALFDGLLPLSLPLECSKALILETAMRGGYPDVLAINDSESRSRWYRSYLQNHILRDMRKARDMRKLNVVARVLESVATYSGRALSKADVAKHCSVAWKTLDKYWCTLETMGLVDMVSGWTKKDDDRPKCAPRGFMTDSGLMAHFLGISEPKVLLEDYKKQLNEGVQLTKTWVYNQLKPEVDCHPTWALNYFRSRQHEIDFLVTNEKGHIVGIEVKASESVNIQDFQDLRWFQSVVGKEHFTGVILYAGDMVRSGGNGLFALPMAALWSDVTQWKAL